MNKQQQAAILANLHKLREFWLTVDPASVDMDIYRNPCGSVACLVGHACMAGLFQEVMKLVPISMHDRDPDSEHTFTLVPANFSRPTATWRDYPGGAIVDAFDPGGGELFEPFPAHECDATSLDMLAGYHKARDEIDDGQASAHHAFALRRIDAQIVRVTKDEEC